jgi:hypothetical protein
MHHYVQRSQILVFVHTLYSKDCQNKQRFSPKERQKSAFVMSTEYVFCEVSSEHLFKTYKAVASFRQLIAGQSPRNLAFVPGAVRGRFLVGPKWHYDRFFSVHFDVPLSASFRQCPILSFVFVLLFEEGQADEVWEIPNGAVLGYWRTLDRKCFDMIGF